MIISDNIKCTINDDAFSTFSEREKERERGREWEKEKERIKINNNSYI